MTSLRGILSRRLLIVGVLLTLTNLALTAAYYLSDVAALRREKVDTELDRLAAAVTPGPSGPHINMSASLQARFTDNPSAYAFRVQAGQQILVQANTHLLPDERWHAPPNVQAWWAGFPSQRGQGALGGRVFDVGGTPVTVVFASVADPDNLLAWVFIDELIGHTLLPLIPFAILLTVVNIWTVRSSLKPVARVAREADRIDPASPDLRLAADGLPAELLPLVSAVNRLLERLSRSLAAERAFAAEAAHILRTPLAILSARIAGVAPGTIPSEIAADVAQVERTVRQLLADVRASSLIVGPARLLNLAEIAETVVASKAPDAIRSSRQVELEVDHPDIVRGDPDAITHALNELVENALRYAPVGTDVQVRVGPGPTIHVMDFGPGFHGSLEGRIAERFAKGPESSGTGLGLSIVSRIMAAHGGRITTERNGPVTRVSMIFAAKASPAGSRE